MKRGLSVVYTVVTLVFFLAVVIVILYRLGSVRDRNVAEAEESFQRIRSEIARTAEETEEPTSRLVQEGFRRGSARPSRLDAFAAYGLEDDIEYLWARSREIIDETARETPRFTYDRISQTRVSGSVELSNRPPLLLEGIYTVLAPGEIFTLLRDALIAVLAFAFVAAVLAVGGLLRAPRNAGAADSAADRVSGDSPAAEPAAGHAPETSPPSPKPKAPSASTSAPDAGSSGTGDTDGGPEIGPGLFSPQSGVSPEAHLEKRLSLELERAASNDQDLTICFAEYPRVLRGSEEYRTAAQELVEHFGFEDLIFEYGKHGFCVLLPNVELHEAIGLTEDFQSRYVHTLGTGGDRRGAESEEQPTFGLSSRNGRLVEAARLLREARQALSKA
ncbi:MAG: hypothetical protein ACLFUX_09275, partial [Spirochaetaceae bacterium]